MLHYSSNKSTVIFALQYKKHLTESSCITGKIGHSKILKIEDNRKYKGRHYIIQKTEDIKM